MELTNANYLVLGTSAMLLMVGAIIGFAFLFQRKLGRKAQAFREIEKLLQQQELNSAYSLLQGQEQERKRIAAELHDNIGGLLATLKIYSDLIWQKESPLEIKRLNEKINHITENLGNEIRKLSHALDLRTLSGFGLRVALEQLCEAINESEKIKVECVLEISREVKDEVSFHVYRIIQELITNTLKHSQATRARLEVTLIENEMTLIFEDNGKGFQVGKNASGMGLGNIQTRINHLGGKLTIDSSSKGSTFIAEINVI
jgi:two-component system, NarL family, sensor kinase